MVGFSKPNINWLRHVHFGSLKIHWLSNNTFILSKVRVLFRFNGHGSALSSLILCISETHTAQMSCHLLLTKSLHLICPAPWQTHWVLGIDVLPSKMSCIFYLDLHNLILTFTFFVYFLTGFLFQWVYECVWPKPNVFFLMASAKVWGAWNSTELSHLETSFEWVCSALLCSIPMWSAFFFGEILFLRFQTSEWRMSKRMIQSDAKNEFLIPFQIRQWCEKRRNFFLLSFL